MLLEENYRPSKIIVGVGREVFSKNYDGLPTVQEVRAVLECQAFAFVYLGLSDDEAFNDELYRIINQMGYSFLFVLEPHNARTRKVIMSELDFLCAPSFLKALPKPAEPKLRPIQNRETFMECLQVLENSFSAFTPSLYNEIISGLE